MRTVPAPTRQLGLRWWLERHRRAVSAACVAVAVWAGLAAVRPARQPTVPVVVAAHDLSPGTVLSAGDLRTVGLPPAAVPPAALRPGAHVAGQSLAVAVPGGVPITPSALSVGRLLPAGTEAVPVRLTDPGAAALLRAGDRVDVLAARGDPTAGLPDSPAAGPSAGIEDGAGPGAAVVASGVVVLSVPPVRSAVGDQGGLVVVAATPAQATALARAAAGSRLSVTVRGT